VTSQGTLLASSKLTFLARYPEQRTKIGRPGKKKKNMDGARVRGGQKRGTKDPGKEKVRSWAKENLIQKNHLSHVKADGGRRRP